MKRRVLVTGGAGFIGSHIVERLIADGHQVAVLDNLSTGDRGNVPDQIEFFELDITEDVRPAFEAFCPDCVVHQAAQVSVSNSIKDPGRDAQTNILGSIRVIEACHEFSVKRMTYASSAAAYGALDTLPLVETLRTQPVSFYGCSKYSVEHYLRTANSEWGMEWVALRYSNVYGPRQSPHGEAGVVAIFSNLILEGKRPTIFGGGELTRDYVYVEDVAEANRLAVVLDVADHPDPVFNVSTGHPTSTNRVFELLCDKLGVEIESVSGPDRPGDVQDSLLDNRKFSEFSGWLPRVSLEDGFEKTARFFMSRARSV